MDLFLHNANLLPRDQVRIERVAATPYPDGRRVKVEVDVTPFQERPNLEIVIRDQAQTLVATASVITPMHFKMEFNLHLRGIEDSAGDYRVQVQLYYEDIQSPQDTREIMLHIPGGS